MSCSTDEPKGTLMSKHAFIFMHTLAITRRPPVAHFTYGTCVSAEGWEKIQILWGMNDLRPEL